MYCCMCFGQHSTVTNMNNFYDENVTSLHTLISKLQYWIYSYYLKYLYFSPNKLTDIFLHFWIISSSLSPKEMTKMGLKVTGATGEAKLKVIFFSMAG